MKTLSSSTTATLFALLALQSLHLLLCDARPTFVQRIPNGALVSGARAIGHQNPNGGGPTNAFGEAFEAQGAQWTRAVCEADSDGDGATNGEELGDPCCQWQQGRGSAGLSSTVSHPGVPNAFTEAQLAALRCLPQPAAAETTTPPATTSPVPSPVSIVNPPSTTDGARVQVDSAPGTPMSPASAEDPGSKTDDGASVASAPPPQRSEAPTSAPARTPAGAEISASHTASLGVVVTLSVLPAVAMVLQ